MLGDKAIRYVSQHHRRILMIRYQAKDERQAEAAVALLAHIIQILTPLPFFRTPLIGLVKKLISSNEPLRNKVSMD